MTRTSVVLALALALACAGEPPLGPPDGVVVYGTISPPGLVSWSEYERYVDRRHLEHNGFPPERASWREAAVYPDESVRLWALRALAEEPEPADLPVFRASLDDEDARVRLTAAGALLTQGSDEGRALLLSTVSADETTTDALLATQWLGRAGDPRGLPHIDRALASEESSLRYAAMDALFHLAQGGGAGQELWARYEVALHHPDDTLVSMAVAQLDELRDPASKPILEAWLPTGRAPLEVERMRALVDALYEP